jgi:hypothetical protein
MPDNNSKTNKKQKNDKKYISLKPPRNAGALYLAPGAHIPPLGPSLGTKTAFCEIPTDQKMSRD